MDNQDTKPQKIIDAKLPLSWLISSTVAVIAFLASALWAVFNQSAKLDILITQTTKLERRMDDRDARIDNVIRDIYDQKRVNDLQDLRIGQLEGRHSTGDRSTK
ncbi:hypothetical protein [Cupriavidus basilensis]|nr:hypothetical protein [Cupriavidus basilensis]